MFFSVPKKKTKYLTKLKNKFKTTSLSSIQEQKQKPIQEYLNGLNNS